mmetsp:Transcript_58054/g.175503  ORF Transcript_58054/g.175503 Transcript_58054/m.175503 type:complete len:966 (+) Transcript_58054:541-3438(+)
MAPRGGAAQRQAGRALVALLGLRCSRRGAFLGALQVLQLPLLVKGLHAGLALPLHGRDCHAGHARARAASRAVGQQVPVALEGQDVGIEVAHGDQLQEVAGACQRHDRPGRGLPQGPLPGRGRVQRLRVVEGRGRARAHGNPVAHARRERRGDGDEEEAEEAALEREPLVPQDGHDGRPHGSTARRVDAQRDDDSHHEERRAVVQVPQVVERERTHQAAGRQQAAEVPHGPRPPDGHPLEGVERRGEQDGADERDAREEVAELGHGPAVERPPLGVLLGRVLPKEVQHLRREEEQVGLVRGDALQHARGGQDVRGVAVRGLEEADQGAERDDQDDLLREPVHAGAPQRHREPRHAHAEALEEADAPAGHLEAAVEVLVEVPDDEEQPRRALHAAEAVVRQDALVGLEEGARQGGHDDEEEDVRELRARHEEVRGHAPRERQPDEAAEGCPGVEGDPERVVAAAALRRLQPQGLSDGGEDVAQRDDDVDPEADAAHGLHEPQRHVVPLRDPLLGLADVALQRLGVPLATPAPCPGHVGLHDLVRPLLAHGLRQELRGGVDVQHPHLRGHDLRGGHGPQGGVAPRLHGRADGLHGRLLPGPEVVQGPGVALLLPEVLQRPRVGLLQALAPGVEGELRARGRAGHLPILRVGQAQGVVHGAEEGLQQHPLRVGVLLAEVDAGHLPKAAHSAAHGRHAQQAELHVHVAEGLGDGGREAEVRPPAHLLREPEELGADEEPATELGLQRHQELLRVEAAGVVRGPGQHDLDLRVAAEQAGREHGDVVDALLLHPAPDEDQDLRVRVRVQAAAGLQGRLRLDALLLEPLDARRAGVGRRVGGVVQGQDAREAREERALAPQLGGVAHRDAADAVAPLRLPDVDHARLEHVEAALEGQVPADGRDLEVEDEAEAPERGDGLPEPVADGVRLDDAHVLRVVQHQDHGHLPLALHVERRQRRVVVHAVEDVRLQR